MLMSLIGGVLIGLSTALLLALNGRIAGVSGIVYGILSPQKNEVLWRLLFVLGLAFGGLIFTVFQPEAFLNLSGRAMGFVALAGLLVGFGTIMGSGCTSGHGVCGMARISKRSIVATLVFMGFGILTVYVMSKI